jgi:hypothetical protein
MRVSTGYHRAPMWWEHWMRLFSILSRQERRLQAGDGTRTRDILHGKQMLYH